MSRETHDARTHNIQIHEDAEGNMEYLCKVAFVGDYGVGKTSLLKRWIHNLFSQHYKVTVGVDFAVHVVNSKDSKESFRFQGWDIAGDQRYSSMLRTYLRETGLVCLMWDVTRPDTFDGMKKWLDEVLDKMLPYDPSEDHVSPKEIPFVFIAGKVDLPYPKDKVEEQENDIRTLAKEKGLKHFEIIHVSAKDSIGLKKLDKLDQTLIKMVHAVCEEKNLSENAENNEVPAYLKSPPSVFKNIFKPAEKNAQVAALQEYEPRQFKHTRKVRHAKISEIIKAEGKDLSPQQFVWMLMNLNSLDRECQTAKFIEIHLAANVSEADFKAEKYDKAHREEFEKEVLRRKIMPHLEDHNFYPHVAQQYQKEAKQLRGGIADQPVTQTLMPDREAIQEVKSAPSDQEPMQEFKDAAPAQKQFRPSKNIEKEFVAVKALLDLMTKMEEQVIGFKFVFRLFEKNREKQRIRHHKQIAAVYTAAKIIYDSMWQSPGNSIPESASDVEHNNNDKELERGAHVKLTRDQFMKEMWGQPINLLNYAQLPAAADAILDTLFGARVPVPVFISESEESSSSEEAPHNEGLHRAFFGTPSLAPAQQKAPKNAALHSAFFGTSASTPAPQAGETPQTEEALEQKPPQL